MTAPVFSFVGYSGSGKTTLLCRVVSQLKKRGYRVGTLKHDAHRFEMDKPGKDTWKHAQAGADVVAISSDDKFALIEKPVRELQLEDILKRIEGVDVILIEGYKRELPPKILVVRYPEHLSLLDELPDVIAVATPLSLQEVPVPVFSSEDVDAITSFIESRM
ncbi:MAG: molybdopterin-guanine dinucleotide biosynthesis protein B [Bacillaceae bacterium]|nr:molybdopterin-guanine dinucleotide biosynthesis protein B [Bacillaceae bacterium]